MLPPEFSKPIFYISKTPVTLAGLIAGLAILFGSFVLSWLLQRVLSARLSKMIGLNEGVSYALRRIIHYTILVFGFIFATQTIGLNLASLAFVMGFLSVGIGFGLQNITSNFVSGLILLLERPISVGEFVTVEEADGPVMGVVEKINMRSTLVKTFDNVAVMVPNSKFIENQVTNWSHGDPKVRLQVPIGVAYGSDVEKVKQVLLEVADKHPLVLKDPAPYVFFLEFGDSSLNFKLYAWLKQPDIRLKARSELNFAIDKAFRENDITIPFPQRDLHVKMTPAIELLGKSSGN
ncbi:hypothetical protein BVX98_06735 [bacterium F11]|nr:hypothetical protein BVX98_06735 [bacterium F11]